MKTIPIALAAHYETGCTTVAAGLVITRDDASVFRWTSHDRDVTIDGNLYSAAPGLDVTAIVTSMGLAVNNLELRILYDDDVITRADLLAGLWDNAQYELFEFNWASPTDGMNPITSGRLGEISINTTSGYVVELRSKSQALQRPVGDVLQLTCRYRFGSQARPDGLCMVSLAAYTVTGTLTSVSSNQVFTDTARTEADDWFGEGVLTMTSGPNAGYSRKVKLYASDQFTLALAMPFTVSVGNTYSVYAGCRKRFDEDCKTKFSNALNFGGEPHGQGVDAITASVDSAA